MNNLLRILFHVLVVRPVCLVVLGLNVRHRERLPRQGPAILVANHNSHLDALVLMTLFPLRRLKLLRPVAAADYFLSNRWLRWFSLHIMGIIPIDRTATNVRTDRLQPISQSLEAGEIVVLFPEGSRGEPEQLSEFKSGVAHLAKRHPEVPVIPVYMHGLGKALPRGEAILVPFFCDIFIGEAIHWAGNRNAFMEDMQQQITALAAEGMFPEWK